MKLSVLLLFFGIILFNSYLPAYAQVSLSPTAIYIHDQLNIGSLQISNGPDATREVSVSFEFGYPSADSSGNLIMVYNDTINRDRHGIGDNLRAFPRRFRIPPGGLQTVRVQVIDMNDKPDGVYWERMIITSEESPGDIEEVKVSKGIGARISYIFIQNIALFYIKGETTTGLIPGKSDFSVEEGILKVMTKLTPVGNS
ncbi:MAG: hypothetical protein PHH93_10665, partial [Prolixibacteraceae bacterium]|nr:hypothetical protein [Prolixibacteraceae bacterium]